MSLSDWELSEERPRLGVSGRWASMLFEFAGTGKKFMSREFGTKEEALEAYTGLRSAKRASDMRASNKIPAMYVGINGNTVLVERMD